MKNIKKIKSYGKAVAGSALLIGATLAGGAAFATAQDSGSSGSSYTLGDYPAPFVGEDGNVQSTVVVGENAKTVDVVGAVNIAGSLGNAAFAEETVEGATPDVNGLEFTEAIRGTITGSTMDASDFDGLVRKSVEDEEEEEHFVVEKATVGSSGAVGADYVNGTDVFATAGGDAVEYAVDYTPGFDVGESITVLGQEYEITDVRPGASPQEVDLGSAMEQAEMAVGDSYDHGPYTVSVTDADKDNAQVYVQIAEGETVLKSAALKDGETVSTDSGDLDVTAEQIFFGTEDHITLSSVYTDTTVVEGEDSPFDEDYTVSRLEFNASDGGDAVQGITLQSDVYTNTAYEDTDTEDDRAPLEAGDALAGPSDYFSLTYTGLSDESTGTVKVTDGRSVTYTDVEGFEQTVDMDNVMQLEATTVAEQTYVTDVEGHPVTVEVTDNTVTSANVDVSYETFSTTFTDLDLEADGDDTVTRVLDTGYGFTVAVQLADSDTTASTGSLTVDVDADGIDTTEGDATLNTQLGAGIAADGFDNVEIDEDFGTPAGAMTVDSANANLEVEFDAGVDAVIQEVDDNPDDDTDGTGDDFALTSENSEARSTFGSTVDVGSGMDSATFEVPENALNGQFAFGEVGEATGDQTTSTPTGWPDAAALDSDVDSATRTGDNLILVGGPLVNNLTAELADEGDTWNSSQYEDNQGTGVLDLVNDAFVDGKSALVVAGWQGEDTRRAANFIADYEQNADALADKSTVQINTASGEVVQ